MTREEVDRLQKRCQIGCRNLDDANNLLAQCYGALGALWCEIEELRKATFTSNERGVK